MLKSLGQWTTASVTPRKIIPSPIRVAAMRQDSAGSEIKEPKPQVQLEKETTGYIQDSPNILFSFENCNI